MNGAFQQTSDVGVNSRSSVRGSQTSAGQQRLLAVVARSPEQEETIISGLSSHIAANGGGSEEQVAGAVRELVDVGPKVFAAETQPRRSLSERIDDAAVQAAIEADNSTGVSKYLKLGKVALYSVASGLTEVAHGDFSNLKEWLPDGYGVTIQVQGEREPRTFRSGAEAETFIATLPEHSIRDITFYGHGAPGMMQVEDGYNLTAEGLGRILGGKMVPSGAVHLVGCNTASIGEGGVRGINVPGASAYGLSTLTRRLLYFSVPYFSGMGDKQIFEDMWDENLAGDVSKRLPGVRVEGMRTFAIPLDRMVPGFLSQNDTTPSEHILARRGVYVDGKAVDE